jgi:hypothetical protein
MDSYLTPGDLNFDNKEAAQMDEQEREYLLQQVRQVEQSNRRWKLATITLVAALAIFLIVGGLSSMVMMQVQAERARAAEAAARLQQEKALRHRADEKQKDPGDGR